MSDKNVGRTEGGGRGAIQISGETAFESVRRPKEI